jgi:hypothetical protein
VKIDTGIEVACFHKSRNHLRTLEAESDKKKKKKGAPKALPTPDFRPLASSTMRK